MLKAQKYNGEIGYFINYFGDKLHVYLIDSGSTNRV
jgi:hypothetical protein